MGEGGGVAHQRILQSAGSPVCSSMFHASYHRRSCVLELWGVAESTCLLPPSV